MKIIGNVKNPSTSEERVIGLLGGMNTFQDETLIKDSEMILARNIILNVDGISPRPGTLRFGSSDGTRVRGGFGFYKSDGTKQHLRFVSGSNNKLQYFNGSTPTDIGSVTYNPNYNMNFVQARDKVFIFNGDSNLSYYDGSTVTTYTALSTPTGLGVTATGTTGSTAYSYRVSAFNAVGETLACVSVAIANGNATLSASNYNALTWTTVTGATGYNIWGNKATGLGETYMATVYTNSYNDNGADSPSLTFLPPEGNTTQGIKCSYGCFAISRIFASGDLANPSRMYFGGTGENVGNFSGSPVGGGGLDVFKNDGSIIRSILPFQGGVIIWKDNAIYKFSFTDDGAQKLEEITRSFGGISFLSCKHVENDVLFAAQKDGRIAIYSLGNQENYAGSVLRTNELSIKVSEELQNINLSRISDCAAFYFNSIYGIAISTSGSSVNNRIWCLDSRFGAWTYWDGITPNSFYTYVDTDNSTNLYFGDESSGYTVEMFQTAKSDSGTAIDVRIETKAFNQKAPNKYKNYYYPVIQFKNVSSSTGLTGEIKVDGIVSVGTFTINQQTTGGSGIGAMSFGEANFGEAYGGEVVDGVSSDILVEMRQIYRNRRSIKYVLRSNAVDADFKLLAIIHKFQSLDNKRLESRFHAQVSA